MADFEPKVFSKYGHAIYYQKTLKELNKFYEKIIDQK